jgi:Indoleamine 2,3-dioxygenase
MFDVFPGVPDELIHSWHTDLGGETGFLPRLTPADTLPARWTPYLNAALELPDRYHFVGADVQPWLASLFAHPVPNADAAIQGLSEPQADRLETVLGVLCHAFRWASAPPAPERYLETAVTLPAGLADVWAAFARARGNPRVGNMFAIVLSNWRLHDVPGNARYSPDELRSGTYSVAIPWLQQEKMLALTTFLGASLETEARGAPAIQTAVQLVGAALNDDQTRVASLLERFNTELKIMSEPFMHYVRKANFSSDDFLTLIQPTTIWGLDEGDGVLEGVSGPQIGVLQIADSVLGIDRSSAMGQAALHTRTYLPARQQKFIQVFEQHCAVVSAYVLWKNEPALVEPFNACLDAMMMWRRMHQKRGAMNLKSNLQGAAYNYTSSGGGIALEDERVARFEDLMQQRMDETRGARVEPAFNAETEELLPHPKPVDRTGLPERRGQPVQPEPISTEPISTEPISTKPTQPESISSPEPVKS